MSNLDPPSSNVPLKRRWFARPTWTETRYVADILRAETVGGGLLLLGALFALAWANSP